MTLRGNKSSCDSLDKFRKTENVPRGNLCFELDNKLARRKNILKMYLFFLFILVNSVIAKAPFQFAADDKHEDVIVEYGQEVTLECSTVDKKFDYVEWFRNDSSYPVIQKLEDYSALVSTNFTSRAELKEKNLHLKHVKFEDAAVYVCRTAVRHGEENVSVQHGTFWKLIVKHEEL